MKRGRAPVFWMIVTRLLTQLPTCGVQSPIQSAPPLSAIFFIRAASPGAAGGGPCSGFTQPRSRRKEARSLFRMGRVFSHKTMIDDKPDGRWDGLTLVVIVMGVAGSGKTTVGSALAAARGWRFVDADDLHTPASVVKMARGEPLDDADRAPWLARLRAIIAEALGRDEPLVLACSALKARY